MPNIVKVLGKYPARHSGTVRVSHPISCNTTVEIMCEYYGVISNWVLDSNSVILDRPLEASIPFGIQVILHSPPWCDLN